MRAVVQRVTDASVVVDSSVVSSIGNGLLVLLCAVSGDDEKDVEYITRKISSLRVFPDSDGKMNLNINQVGGSILLVSQFTLAGDVRRGNRPEFTTAMRPESATVMINQIVDIFKGNNIKVEQGVFGAHMEVKLTNDGPVTILLDSKKVF